MSFKAKAKNPLKKNIKKQNSSKKNTSTKTLKNQSTVQDLKRKTLNLKPH